MAELPYVVPGEPIDSTDFGNPVIDRVLSRYTDAAARDAAVPTPIAGDSAYLTSTGTWEVYDGAAWQGFQVSRIEAIDGGATRLLDPLGNKFWEWDESSTLIRGYIQGAEAMRLRGAQGLQLGDALFGTDAFPAFSWISDADTGMYRVAANHLGFAVGGFQKLAMRSDFVFIGGGTDGYPILKADSPGTGDAPAYAFGNDADTGMYRAAANNLQFVAGGNQVLGMSTTSFVAPSVYTATTAAAANVWVQSDGAMRRSTAAMAYLDPGDIATVNTRAGLAIPADSVDLLPIIEHLLDRIDALEAS